MAQFRLIITLNEKWADEKHNEKVSPMADIVSLMTAEWDMTVVEYNRYKGVFDIINFENREQLDVAFRWFAEETFGSEFNVNNIVFSIEEILQVDNIQPTTMDKINALVGAEEFKELAKECELVSKEMVKHNALDTFTRRVYLFSINDGEGLTTYLSHFGELLKELHLFDFGLRIHIRETKVDAPGKDTSASNNPFSPAINCISRGNSNFGKIVCVDISEWMTKTNDRLFKDFLERIDNNIGANIIVLRVPFVEKEVLEHIKESIADVLSVRTVSFVPLDNNDLIRCADDKIREYGFSMRKSAWETFKKRLEEERNDGRFYGIKTVNKIVRETIYLKQLSNAKKSKSDVLISKSDISGLIDKENKTYGFEMLDTFIGMEPIKQRITEIVAQIEVAISDSKFDRPCIHMRFVGNPGTGKTTVARVIGKILKDKGILRNGNFFEYSGRDFCGRYVGETAPKTAAMCRDAYGSVMFIDEAYSLYRGVKSNDFGKEAIDTLIAEMENHRTDFVVIMAGYPDDMDTLMRANAGLASRMPYIIEFPNYTKEQLYEIYISMASNNFKFDDDFKSEVKKYFDSLSDDFVNSKEFSNARFVRNLYERTWGKAILRSQMRKTGCKKLLKEDFIAASAENEFKVNEKSKSRIGFA